MGNGLNAATPSATYLFIRLRKNCVIFLNRNPEAFSNVKDSLSYKNVINRTKFRNLIAIQLDDDSSNRIADKPVTRIEVCSPLAVQIDFKKVKG